MTRRLNVAGIDTSIFMHPKVWGASGHIEGFTDPLSDCRACKRRFRPLAGRENCPECGSKDITPARNFNLMFKSSMGPVEGEGSTVWLRPETAQGIYVNFLNVQKSGRYKPPFGIAQIGKAFRNEITPSHALFRMREFEQMEMQFFVPPEEGEKHFAYWREERKNWLSGLGLKEGELCFHTHGKDELAHYALYAEDIEYRFPKPLGKEELEGLHIRGDFDLSRHERFSGKKLRYFDPDKKISYRPHVVETSIGCDRLFLALLCSAYQEEKMEKGETRVVLDLNPDIAPVRLAVLPLQKDPGIVDTALKIQKDMRQDYLVAYDDTGSIGKRYRRQDEIGAPFCATVDFQSLKDEKITVRRRDILEQLRIPISHLRTFLNDRDAFQDPQPLGPVCAQSFVGKGEAKLLSSANVEVEEGFEKMKKQGQAVAGPPGDLKSFPSPESFYLPVLKSIAEKGPVGGDKTAEEVSTCFQLSDRQKKEKSLGGSQSKVYNRTIWALSHLKSLGFIEKEKGLWRLNETGRCFLSLGDKLGDKSEDKSENKSDKRSQEDFLKELVMKARQAFVPLPLSPVDVKNLVKF